MRGSKETVEGEKGESDRRPHSKLDGDGEARRKMGKGESCARRGNRRGERKRKRMQVQLQERVRVRGIQVTQLVKIACSPRLWVCMKVDSQQLQVQLKSSHRSMSSLTLALSLAFSFSLFLCIHCSIRGLEWECEWWIPCANYPWKAGLNDPADWACGKAPPWPGAVAWLWGIRTSMPQASEMK